MLIKKPGLEEIETELKFTTSRSGGPGGQSVNKVNSKVTLRWDVGNSTAIDDEQRTKIMTTLAKVINNDGEVVITAQTNRSQLQNKQEVIAKLDTLLTRAFTVRKVRKATKPTKSSKLKRLDNKKKQSIKKNLRRGIDD
jgi:ribosome-associated protein